MPELNLFSLITLWLVVCAILLRCMATGQLASAGLIPAYLANLALLHFFGAATFLLPGYAHMDRTMTEIGFAQSLWGLSAFAVGSLLFEPVVRSLFEHPHFVDVPAMIESRLPTIYTFIAGILYFGASPWIATVPTLSALLSSMFNLFVVGLALMGLKGLLERRSLMLMVALAGALSLPFVSVLRQGFLGIGMGACLIVFVFVGNSYRPRRHAIVCALLTFYLAFSFYVTYMRDRAALREVIWGAAPMADRIDVLSYTLGNIEWFNPAHNDHLGRIDDRLNLNHLVGAAVDYIGNGYKDFAYGATLWEAVLALVPRVLWPEKPVAAGSGDLVTQYTGIVFSEGTSVGIGQVMEFYINFGTPGVVLGFMAFGVLVASLDRKMVECLNAGDWAGVAFWFMPGIALLNVGGSLVEVTAGFGACIIALWIINKLLAVTIFRIRQPEAIATGGTPRSCAYDRY